MKRFLVFMSMLIVSFCLVYSEQEMKIGHHKMFTVTICRPQGGEKLHAGSQYQIQWCQPTKMFGNIMFSLLKEDGSNAINPYSIKNKGIYKWQIPKNIQDGKYRIKIGPGKSSIFEITGGIMGPIDLKKR